jgi:CheY-like chemotaxis protein
VRHSSSRCHFQRNLLLTVRDMPRPTHRMLLLEDDDLAIESFNRTIAEYNADQTKAATFEPQIVKAKDEALALMLSRRIDCAVIDIRVPEQAGGGSDARNGNTVVEEILASLPIPVVVYSGHTQEIDEGRARDADEDFNEGGWKSHRGPGLACGAQRSHGRFS